MGIKERKEREKGRRRQQIIVAAKRVFNKKGFNLTTMEDIAKEAELSPGTLYLYFKSKEELYASLSLRVLQYLSLRIEQISCEKEIGADPLANLEKLIDAMYDVYEFDPINIIKIIHLQSSKILNNLSPQLLLEFNVLSKKSINTIAGIFEHGIKQGAIIDRHPVALADIFWSLFSGTVLWETSKNKIDYKKAYLKQTLNVAFKIFRNGITENK